MVENPSRKLSSQCSTDFDKFSFHIASTQRCPGTLAPHTHTHKHTQECGMHDHVNTQEDGRGQGDWHEFSAFRKVRRDESGLPCSPFHCQRKNTFLWLFYCHPQGLTLPCARYRLSYIIAFSYLVSIWEDCTVT